MSKINKILDLNNYYEANKKLWDKLATVHVKSDFYDQESFLAGKLSLKEIELEEVGDVANKQMLHLQCHFGQDSISWAKLGAKVVAVDFSEGAISIAKDINEKLGTDVNFICSNVYDLEEHVSNKFDIVYTSYGVINWLHDLDKWGQLIAKYLNSGGYFYMVEFHPILWIYDDKFQNIEHPYQSGSDPLELVSDFSYADINTEVNQKEYCWNHGIGRIVNALISAGLKIEFFNEYNYSPYKTFSEMTEFKPGSYIINKFGYKVPHLFSIKASKA